MFLLTKLEENQMGGHKTRDGIKLRNILKIAREIGAIVREGTNHKYILNYEKLRPCPVAISSDARTMIAPWLSQINNQTPWKNYQALRNRY